jgi:hypothetical protein
MNELVFGIIINAFLVWLFALAVGLSDSPQK